MKKDKKDEELIDEIKQGNIFSFEILVIRYQKKLLNFTKGITKDKVAAEEIVQDTFFKIYQKINSIDTEKKFSSYLFKIAKNEAISFLRSKKNHLVFEEEMVAGEDRVYSTTESNDLKSWLNEKINKLEKKYRETLKLYYFEELSYQEIGDKLSLPINTVRTHLKRAKNYLKNIIENDKN